jgi:hypothetical protein
MTKRCLQQDQREEGTAISGPVQARSITVARLADGNDGGNIDRSQSGRDLRKLLILLGSALPILPITSCPGQPVGAFFILKLNAAETPATLSDPKRAG